MKNLNINFQTVSRVAFKNVYKNTFKQFPKKLDNFISFNVNLFLTFIWKKKNILKPSKKNQYAFRFFKRTINGKVGKENSNF